MKICNQKVKRNYMELPIGDPEQSGGTVKKMEHLLSLSSKDLLALEIGLRKTVTHIKSKVKS